MGGRGGRADIFWTRTSIRLSSVLINIATHTVICCIASAPCAMKALVRGEMDSRPYIAGRLRI